MPLNVKKDYAFVPTAVGPVRLTTRSSRRSRLWAGGSFWRSIARGAGQNQIQISCVEDLTDTQNPQGLLVVFNTGLLASENIFADGISAAQISLYDLSLNWDEEIRITVQNGLFTAKRVGIRWQIGGGETSTDIGNPVQGKVFTGSGVKCKIDSNPGSWPPGSTLYLRPRVRRYPLVVASVTLPEETTSTIGWNIEELRASLNGSDPWVTMPTRPQVEIVTTVTPPGPPTGDGGTGTPGGTTQTIVHHTDGPHADSMDHGEDYFVLAAFDLTNMTGGDGLPANPVGLNTGPDRSLVHLNYSELDDGSLGLLNQVFEWVGDTVSSGSWQRYS